MLAVLAAVFATTTVAAPATSARYLVEAATAAEAHERVERVQGTVERDLEIIHGVAATLDAAQAAELRAMTGVRVYADHGPLLVNGRYRR